MVALVNVIEVGDRGSTATVSSTCRCRTHRCPAERGRRGRRHRRASAFSIFYGRFGWIDTSAVGSIAPVRPTAANGCCHSAADVQPRPPTGRSPNLARCTVRAPSPSSGLDHENANTRRRTAAFRRLQPLISRARNVLFARSAEPPGQGPRRGVCTWCDRVHVSGTPSFVALSAAIDARRARYSERRNEVRRRLRTFVTALRVSLTGPRAATRPRLRKRSFAGLIPAQSFSDSRRFGHAMQQGINARRPRVQR